MPGPALVIFDDGGGAFGPLTDLRACFELRSGAHLGWQRIEHALGVRLDAVRGPAPLVPLLTERLSAAVNRPFEHDDLLLVNGRWLGVEEAARIAALTRGCAIVAGTGSTETENGNRPVIAARLGALDAEAFLASGQLGAGIAVQTAADSVLIRRPWDLLQRIEQILLADLRISDLPRCAPPAEATVMGDYPVHAAADVVIEPGARLLAMQGPIVLEAGTHVGANAVIYGPTWVGPQTRVNAQATIGPHVVLGPHCKVGGEVKSACLHGYSNKAHSGFLGNAIVGEWVNLGADTTVSNLKNTYGSVRVQLDPDGVPEDTGRTFHGPIIGDHVLTAVGTRLLTGTCIGTGAMVALSGFAPKYVAGMCFHTDGSAQPYDLPAFITSARRRMARRGVEPSEAMIARWHALAQRAL